MEQLGIRDIRRLLDLLRELYELCDLDAFQTRVLSILPGLVPSEISSYNEVNPLMRRIAGTSLPSFEALETVHPGHRCIFEQHMADHPLTAHYHRTSDGRALKISDFLSQRQFHALGLYQEFFWPLRVEHQIAITVPAPPPLVVGIALNRGRGRDFAERERLLLNLLRPHLVQAYRNAEAVTRARHDPSLALQAIGELDLPYGLILLTADLRIETATPRAREMLATYWGETVRRADRLPDDLERWVRPHLVLHERADDIPPPREPFTAERQERRLVVCMVGGADRVLLLEEHPTIVHAAHLAPMGLTRREAEVLAWVTHGKTNAEIAQILGTSRHTVAHQLQRIYDKLGVETRTAAAALALETMHGRKP